MTENDKPPVLCFWCKKPLMGEWAFPHTKLPYKPWETAVHPECARPCSADEQRRYDDAVFDLKKACMTLLTAKSKGAALDENFAALEKCLATFGITVPRTKRSRKKSAPDPTD